MSTQIGHHLFKGKINNTRGYKRKGNLQSKTFEGTKGGASKTTFDTAPSMLVNRQNATEFAGASLQSQAFYNHFLSQFPNEVKKIFTSLQKNNVSIIKQSTGSPGSRDYTVTDYKNDFYDFQIGFFPFRKFCSASLEFIQSPDRLSIDCVYGDNLHERIIWPKPATHYRLTTLYFNKQNSYYNNIIMKYVNYDTPLDCAYSAINHSPWFSRTDNTDVYDPGSIGDGGVVLGTNTAMFCVCCIEFAQYINSNYEILTNYTGASILFIN